MKRGRKQLLSLALAALLGVGLLPAPALAEEPEGSISPAVEEAGQIGETEDVIPIIDSGQCGDNVNWRLTENGALVIFGSGDMWDYTVQNAPKWMSSYAKQITRIVVMEGVTSIGGKAFYTGPYPQQIKPEEILLPQSLKKIGNYAFANSVSGSLTLPEGLQEIGEGAFVNCKITGELRVPGTVQRIGKQAFNSCEELESLVLEEGVQEICEEAFAQCSSLKEVHIPASVTAIGSRAFGWLNDSLTDIDYDGTMSQWEQIAAEDAVMLHLTTVHCADGDILPRVDGHCGDDLVWSLDENGVLFISGTGDMWDYGVTNPTWYDVRDQIREIEILPGATGIGDLAFDCSNLERVSIPEGVTRIGRCAFTGCRSLEEILLPESLEQIGDSAFYNCGLIGVNIPESVTSLGESAFGNCSKLTCVTIPGSLSCISRFAFSGCAALESVSMGEGVSVIDLQAFMHCSSLKEVFFPATLTEIGDLAFCYCTDLEQIFFEGGAPSIGQDAFGGVIAAVYYPAWDLSWTEDVRQDYSGKLSWSPWAIYGDVNGDGQANLLDLVRLRKHFAGEAVALLELTADVNQDGEITSLDLIQLRKLLVGATD